MAALPALTLINLPGMILPSIILGIAIGLIEMFFVYQDEMSMGILALTHALHTFPFAILFTFMSMHVEIVMKFLPMLPQTPQITLAIRGVIGLLALMKIAGAAALVKGSMIGEKWIHSFIIAGLIVASPYIWQFIGPAVGLK